MSSGEYTVVYERDAQDFIERLSSADRLRLLKWISKNLEGTTTPRAYGSKLRGELADYWRYRVGDYRIAAIIKDDKVVILIVDAGHRKDFYKKLSRKK